VSENILESYLVQLGATEDVASFVKFHNTLKTAGRAVEGFTTGAVADFVKLEASIVTTFSAFGVGLISLADKTAMADQQFGLMGARMLMTKNSFRSMQMALDTLGVTMNDVMSDTTGELQKEFQDLYARNTELGRQLGGTFDQSMVGIRKTRIEFKQFGTELEFLSMKVVDQLFQKLGFGSGDITAKLREFNNWFTTQLPDMADKVTDVLVPAWKDMTGVLSGVWTNAKGALLSFTNLVGLLSGDSSIESSTLKLENMAKALLHIAHGLAWISGKTMGVFSTAADSAVYVGYALAAKSAYNRSEDPNLSLKDRQDSYQEYRKYQALADQAWNAAGQGFGQLTGSAPVPPNTNPVLGGAAHVYKPMRFAKSFGEIAATVGQDRMVQYMAEARVLYPDVPSNLLAGIIWHESRGHPDAVNPKSGATGLGQFLPSTARAMGITNMKDPEQNIIGMAKYLSMLYGKSGDWGDALAQYGGYGHDTMRAQDYISDVMNQRRILGREGDVVIQNFNVNLPPGTSEQHVAEIRKQFQALSSKATRNVTAQTAAGAHY
jgi:Transglycosylase SLT domain